jgi:hypothetical protein
MRTSKPIWTENCDTVTHPYANSQRATTRHLAD